MIEESSGNSVHSEYEQNQSNERSYSDKENMNPTNAEGSALHNGTGKYGVPVDRGWAWVILFASWCNYLICNGSNRAFGVMFVEIQAKYDSTSSLTSLIISVMDGSYSLTALLVTTIGLQFFSNRQFIVLGGLLMASAYVLSAFAPNVELLILLFGVVNGTGQGLVIIPTTALISEYFEKYRSIANCTANIGSGVGSLIFSVLIPYLIDEYSFTGTVLLLGGVMLQMGISALLMRPTTFYSKQSSKFHIKQWTGEGKQDENKSFISEQKMTESVKNANDIDQLSKTLDSAEENSFAHNQIDINIEEADSYLIVDNESTVSLGKNDIQFEHSRTQNSKTICPQTKGSTVLTLSNSNIGLYARTELAMSSMLDIHPSQESMNLEKNYTNSKDSCSCFRKLSSKFGSIIDCQPMKRIPFLIFIPSACFIVSVASIMIYLPAFAKDSGLTSRECGLLITVISITDMCTVVFWGIFADRNYIQRNKILSFAVITVGVTTCFTPLFKTRNVFFVFSVIFGIFGRVYFSLYPVVVIDFIGLENLRSAIGILGLAQTGASAVLQPIIGMLRDYFKTYVPGMLLISALVIIGGLLMLTLPMAARCEQQKDTKEIHVHE